MSRNQTAFVNVEVIVMNLRPQIQQRMVEGWNPKPWLCTIDSLDNAKHQLNEGDWTEPWWVGPAGDRDAVM